MVVLFWDFDGTLADSTGIWSRVSYAALKLADPAAEADPVKLGEALSFGFTWHFPERDHTEWVYEGWWEKTKPFFRDAYLSCGVEPALAEKAADRIREALVDVKNYKLYEDTVQVLRDMKGLGYKNVLMSNNYPELPEILEGLGLAPYMDGMVISGHIGYDKPRSEMFSVGVNMFPDAEKYYMIGDTVSADIVGGNAMGFTTVLVHKGPCDVADYWFDDLISVKKLVTGTL